MQSLQVRLGVGLIISLIVLFMLEWRIISPAIRSLTTGYVAARLARDATSLMSMVTFSREGKLQIVPVGLDPIYTRPRSGRHFQLRATDGQLLRSASLGAEFLDLPMLAAGQTLRRHITGPIGQNHEILANGWQKQGRTATVGVAEDAAVLERELWQFEARYIAVSLAILSNWAGSRCRLRCRSAVHMQRYKHTRCDNIEALGVQTRHRRQRVKRSREV